MKLIDLLVSHLGSKGGWPIGAEVCAQDNDCEVVFYSRPGIHRRGNNPVWTIPEGVQSVVVKRRIYINLADDTDTAVVSREQYESALAASQQSAWNGDGLPPVGCECEYTMNGGETWWKCTINYIVGCSGLVMACDCPGGEQYVHFESYNRKKQQLKFRPIRTEAERKRDEVIKELDNVYRAIPHSDAVAYGLYDAIASGKIPNITLK